VDVELRGHSHEPGLGPGPRFQVGQERAVRVTTRRTGAAGQQVREDPDALHADHPEPGAAKQIHDLVEVEATPEQVTTSPPTVRVMGDVVRLVQLARADPRQDGSVSLGDEQAEPTGLTQHAADRAEGDLWVVDDLQDAMAQHEVHGGLTQDVAQVLGVTLDTAQPVGDPRLGGPATQRGEGVQARVDDRHVVTGLDQP